MIRIDTDNAVVEVVGEGGEVRRIPFSDPEAFRVVSQAWLRIGWDTKYVYSFQWMGRPVIQLPEDLVRVQEVVHRVEPDVLVETGIAHGGSLVFYASLFKAMDRGRVIGVDVEIRPHNRAAIEGHPLFPLITMIEGSSIDPGVVQEVHGLIEPGERVMVMLDSNHTKGHVMAELDAYSPLVSPGSYIVAADGIMGDLVGAPRTGPDWGWDNPREAAAEWVVGRDDFVLERPPIEFNEGVVEDFITYWPGAWLRRVG